MILIKGTRIWQRKKETLELRVYEVNYQNLPAISTVFLIMMFRQNSRNFPVDILEAARIDGLNEFSIFFRMYMPVMKACYVAAAVITFMNSWNAYDGCFVLFYTNNGCILCTSEAVCRRYYRSSKIN